ncbi:MAG: hypothetical protein F3745_08870 [Nitrospinae bacterium]|nr:hypothetical protein [Nitrospinota bacterium]
MGKKTSPNSLFLEILGVEIGEAILNSKKIQDRFRQISKMGILKDIADQTVGVNLGDLAKEINCVIDTNDSFPESEQNQNENITEPEKPSLQANNIDDLDCQDDHGWEQLVDEEDFAENDKCIKQVDGRKLIPNEIKFQEYLEKDFDEENWLKSVRLDYPVGKDKAA